MQLSPQDISLLAAIRLYGPISVADLADISFFDCMTTVHAVRILRPKLEHCKIVSHVKTVTFYEVVE